MSFYDARYVFYAGLVALVLIIFQTYYKIGHRPRNYPPGPPTLPLVGNLHQIPREKRHLQFEKWARQYGPIYSLILGTKVMIVLNSDLAIKDLLDKRGVIYSSRPEAYIAQDVLSGGLRVLFMVCLSGYSVFTEMLIKYMAPAKSGSVDHGPPIGPPYFERICGTNLRTLSGPWKQSDATWVSTKSRWFHKSPSSIHGVLDHSNDFWLSDCKHARPEIQRSIRRM